MQRHSVGGGGHGVSTDVLDGGDWLGRQWRTVGGVDHGIHDHLSCHTKPQRNVGGGGIGETAGRRSQRVVAKGAGEGTASKGGDTDCCLHRVGGAGECARSGGHGQGDTCVRVGDRVAVDILDGDDRLGGEGDAVDSSSRLGGDSHLGGCTRSQSHRSGASGRRE